MYFYRATKTNKKLILPKGSKVFNPVEFHLASVQTYHPHCGGLGSPQTALAVARIENTNVLVHAWNPISLAVQTQI